MQTIPADVPRVYFAAPITTYTTARYAEHYAHARAHFPDHAVLSARDLFTSNADWRRCWPDLRPTLDALVFIADSDGWIGWGVWLEVAEMAARGRPVWFLTDAGALVAHTAVRMLTVEADRRRYARVDVIDPAEPDAREVG